MKGTCQTVLCLLCADILHLLLSLPHLCCCPCCVVAPGALKTYPMNNWKSLDNGMRFCKSFALADARWSCGHIEVSISGSGSSSSSMGSSDGGAVVALLSLLPLSLLSLSSPSSFQIARRLLPLSVYAAAARCFKGSTDDKAEFFGMRSLWFSSHHTFYNTSRAHNTNTHARTHTHTHTLSLSLCFHFLLGFGGFSSGLYGYGRAA